VRADIPQREFWDFNVDHHAHIDIPAVIDMIRAVKAREATGTGVTAFCVITAASAWTDRHCG
jgi:hypothetical protein